MYDLNEGAGRGADAGLDALLKNSTRVGSVPSDESGAFHLNYDKDDILAINGERRRLDLLIVVTAPDDEETGAAEKVIYYSNPPRLKAGKEETFNIGISRSTMKKFRLGDDANVKEKVSSYKRTRTDERELAEGIVEFHRAEVAQDKEEKKALRAELLKTIATNVEVASLHGELVRDNELIKDKVKVVVEKAVTVANTQINNSAGVPVNLYLTEEDRVRLQPYFASAVGGFATIPEHKIKDILFRPNSSENPGTLLVHQNPIAKFCAEHTFEEKCAQIHTGLAEDTHLHDDTEHPGGDPGGGAGSEIEALTNADVLKYVARLVNSAPSPDGVLTSEFNSQRADRSAVEKAVDTFSLRKGPAEVPAFYDFHSLQIAFEHVWKILIDEHLVNTAHTLDRRRVGDRGRKRAGPRTGVAAPNREPRRTERPADTLGHPWS